MKRIAVLALAAAFSQALAQMGAGPVLQSALRPQEGRDPTLGAQQKPTEPSGFPGLPAKEGPLEPGEDLGQGRVRIIQAGDTAYRNGRLVVTGGAHIQYGGYDIVADAVEGDTRTEVFDATGNVRVTGADARVRGERVRVSARERTYRAWGSEAQIEPTLLKGQFQDPLYVRARESYGSERELFAEDAICTTCNYAEPHYHVDVNHTTVRPGTRAIFRDLRLNVLGKTILRLPYLSVPLTEPSYRYIPEFGQNEQDGYYMRARYGIPLRGENNFDARLDWFEKRGTAIGGDYSYLGRGLTGLLTVYALAGATRTFNLNNRHEQRFSWGTLSLDSSYQKNNFMTAPEATLLSTRAQLLIPQGTNSSRLSLFRTENESSGFSSRQQTIALNDVRRFGAMTRSNLDLAWVTSEGGARREQVDVRLNGEHDLRRAVARFEYQRSIPVGEIDNFFSPSDRTPVLSLASDARRLLGPRAPANLPFTTELSLGEYVDARTRDHIRRSAFDLNFQRPDPPGRRSRLELNGRFRQGIYSDDTAQYLLALGAVANYSLGPDTGINLRYNYLRPYGYSPLSIDQTGRTNLLTADLSYRPLRALLVSAQTGYDLEVLRLGTRTPWQFVGVRTEYTPTSWLNFRALSTYDTEQQVWSNVRLDLAYRPGATYVGIGAEYDGFRHTWGNANLFIDGLKWGRLRTSALLQYNGYLRQFQAQHYSFTYDLHCAEAVLQIVDNQTGFRTGRQVSFFLRLKALPFLSPFGVGSSGQPLGTGTGRQF